MKTNKLPPIHPEEILREEFMKPRDLSQNALARALNVPPRRINRSRKARHYGRHRLGARSKTAPASPLLPPRRCHAFSFR